MSLIFTDETGRVTLVHNMPEILSAQERADSFEVEHVPVPDDIDGKIPVLYRNMETGELYYKYEDRPLTSEEKMQQMEQKQELMEQALDELIFGGAF